MFLASGLELKLHEIQPSRSWIFGFFFSSVLCCKSLLVDQSNIWDLNFWVFWVIERVVFYVGVLGFQESVISFKLWIFEFWFVLKNLVFALSSTY